MGATTPAGATPRSGARTPDPNVFVIFGGSGDLARRKLLPALGRLAAAGSLDRCRVLGVSRRPQTDEQFRALAHESLAAAGAGSAAATDFCARLHYQSLGESTQADFDALRVRLEDLARAHALPPNRAFYLALPPQTYPDVTEKLAAAGLHSSAPGWSRLVLEKPFGRDLASATELHRLVHRHFHERQLYRIDHYLGKDTVQNLLAFRFANALIESAWNRERIESVQIDVSESLGVEGRAEYYDHAGAIRDMLQNHLAQILMLVAMEPPSSFEAGAIRYEKSKVLRCIAPIGPGDVVRGQYAAGTVDGKAVRGYLEEPGVAPASPTETFVAVRLAIDSWRWQGVPFYLRTGKRLPKKKTQIAVRFRDAPVNFFRREGEQVHDMADVLLITLQPDEGFSLHLDVKAPGHPFRLHQVPLRFCYRDVFAELPEAYQTLLLDVMLGDQTLFVHADEVEGAWSVFRPLVEAPPPVRPYPAGTWGPPDADRLAIPEFALWQER